MREDKNSTSGHTVIEMVVITGIIVTVSALLLINFSGLNETVALNRSTWELGLALRKTQNMALAVTEVVVPPPPAVGVRLSTLNPATYFTFADQNGDNIYTSPSEIKIGADMVFERGVKIYRITGQRNNEYSTVHVLFSAPEAVMVIADENGESIGNKIDVELISPSGTLTRTLTVWTTGQITFQQ